MRIQVPHKIADGVTGEPPAELTLATLRRLVERVVVVDDDEGSRAAPSPAQRPQPRDGGGDRPIARHGAGHRRVDAIREVDLGPDAAGAGARRGHVRRRRQRRPGARAGRPRPRGRHRHRRRHRSFRPHPRLRRPAAAADAIRLSRKRWRRSRATCSGPSPTTSRSSLRPPPASSTRSWRDRRCTHARSLGRSDAVADRTGPDRGRFSPTGPCCDPRRPPVPLQLATWSRTPASGERSSPRSRVSARR